MDVRLQNAYVEVLLNNFIEVVKQNLLLQAQHEVNKNGFKEAEYTVEKFKEISDNNIVYQNKLTENDNTIKSHNYLFQRIFGTNIEHSNNYEECDILCESVFIKSCLLNKKKWKYSCRNRC